MNNIGNARDSCDPSTIRQVLVELAGVTDGPVRIGVLRDEGLTFWETARQASTAASSVGPVPAHPTALGQVLLAHTDDGTRDRLITQELRSSRGAVAMTREQVDSALSVTRLSGVAVARTGAAGSGMGVAVPVLDDGGRVVAGIEVQARDFDQMESVLGDLTAAARRVLISSA